MFNKVIIVGHFTRDLEMRYTPSGVAIGVTGIAATKRFKNAAGEQKEDTMFVDITFYGRTAEIANQYLRKGSKVLVEGRLKLNQWTAQDGSKRSKHTIDVESLQMLDSKNSGTQAGAGQPQSHYAQPTNQAQAGTAAPAGTPPQGSQYAAPQAQTAPAAPSAQAQQPASEPSFPAMGEKDEIPF